jgi:polysaccharide transporter, PST family
MSLAANIFWLYGLQALNYLTPLLLVPYLIRVLGPDRYGLLVLSQSLTQYFIIATDYGFNYSATRSITVNRSDATAITKIFWTVTATKGSLLVIGAGVMIAMLAWVPKLHSDRVIYEVAYLGVIGNALFPQWLFQGMENMRSISVVTGATKLGSALCVVLFVHHAKDALLAVLLLSSGQLLSGLIGAFVGIRRYVHGFVLPCRLEILSAIRDGQHLFLTTASMSLFTNTNTLLVGLIAGNTQAGYFGVADKLARATSGLVYPVIQAAYPHSIRLIAESKQALLAFLYKMLSYGSAFAIAAGIAILLLSGRIGHAAFGDNVPTLLILIQCSAAFPPLATVSAILGTLALIPFGCDRAQSRLLLASGLFNLSLAYLLISFHGALGGVISMAITETVIVIGSLALLSCRGVHLLRWKA